MSSASTSSGNRFPSPTKSQVYNWPTYNPYPTHWPYPSTYPSLTPDPYPDPDPPIMYIPDHYSEPLQTLLIVAIVFIVLGIVACAVSCYRGSRARKAREAAAALPGANGPPMHALPLTVTQVQAGIILPAGMQSFPIYVTNQRGQNGEELVLVPRHVLQQPLLQPPSSAQSRVPHPLQPMQSSSKDQQRSVEDENHLRSLEAIRQSSGVYLNQEGSGAGAAPSSSTVNRGELLLQKPYSQQEREHEQVQEGQQKQIQTQQVQEQPQGQQQLQHLQQQQQQQQRQPQSAASSSSSSAALQNGLQTHVVLRDAPGEEEEALKTS